MPTNTQQVSNVFSSDTLNTWREKTNELIKIVNAIPGVPIGSLNRRGGVIDGQADATTATTAPEGTLLVIPGTTSNFAPSVGIGDYALISSFPDGPTPYTLSINRTASGAWANVVLTADKTGISANGISITNGLLTIDVHASDLIGANSNDAVITIGAGEFGAASRGTLGDPNIINLWDSQTGLPSINAYGFGVNDQTLGYTSFEQHAFFTKRSRQNTDNPDIQRLFTINATGIFTQSNTFVLTAQTPATGDLYVQGNAHFGTSYNGVVISNNMVQIDTLADANPAIDLIPSGGHTNATRDTDKIRIWSSGSDTMGFGISADSLDYVASANHVFHTGSTGALGERAVINSLGIYATTDITAGSDVIATGNVVATNVYVGASEGVVISDKLIEINGSSTTPRLVFDNTISAFNIDRIKLWEGGGRAYGFGVRSEILDYLSNNHVFGEAIGGAVSENARINSTGIFSETKVTAATGLVTGVSQLLSGALSINSGQSVLGTQVDSDGSSTSRSKLLLQGGANVAAIVVDSPSTSTAINPNILEILPGGGNANTYGIGHWPAAGYQTYHSGSGHAFYIDRPGNDNTRIEVFKLDNPGGQGAIQATFTANAHFTGDITFSGEVSTTGEQQVDFVTAIGTDVADISTFAHAVHVSGTHINSTSYLTPGAATPSLTFTGPTFNNGPTIDRIDLFNSSAGTIGFGIWKPTSAAASEGMMLRSKAQGPFGFHHDTNLTANIAPGGIETGGYVNAIGGFDTSGHYYSDGIEWFNGSTNTLTLGAGKITATSPNFISGSRIHVTTQGASPIGMFIDSSGTGDTHTAIIINSTSKRAIDLSAGGISMKKGLIIDDFERITQAGKVNATAFELIGSDLELGSGTSLNLFSTTSNLYVGGNAQFGSAASNGVAVLAGVPRSADIINAIDLNHGATTNNEYGMGLDLGTGSVSYHTMNTHSFYIDFVGKEEKMTVNSTGLFVHGVGAGAANIYADHIHGTSTTTGTSTATNLDLTGDIDTEGSVFVGSSVAGAKDAENAVFANGQANFGVVFSGRGVRSPEAPGSTASYWSGSTSTTTAALLHSAQPNPLIASGGTGAVAAPTIISNSIQVKAIDLLNGGIGVKGLYIANSATTIHPQSTGKANLVNIQTVAATQYDMYDDNGTTTFQTFQKVPGPHQFDIGTNGALRNLTSLGNIHAQGTASQVIAFNRISCTGSSAGSGIIDAKQGYDANNILTISPQDTGKANLVNIESVVAQRYMAGPAGAEVISAELKGQLTNLWVLDNFGVGDGEIVADHKITVGQPAGPAAGGGYFFGSTNIITSNRSLININGATIDGTGVTLTSGRLRSTWTTTSTTNAVQTDSGRIVSNSTSATAFYAPMGGITANSYTTVGGIEVINSAGEINVPALKSGTGTTSMLQAGAIISTEDGPIVSDGPVIANNTGSGTALTVPTGTIKVTGSTSADAIETISGGISANTGFSANGALIIDSQPSGNVNIGFVDNFNTANLTTTSNVSMTTTGSHEVAIVGSEITNTFDATGRLIINAHSTFGGIETIHLKGSSGTQIAAIRITKDDLVVGYLDAPDTQQSRVSFQSGPNNISPNSFNSWSGGMNAKTGYSANNVLVIAPQGNGRSDLQNIGAIDANAISISGASVISTGVSGTSADIDNIRNFKSIGTTSTSIDTDGGISAKTGYWSNTEQIIVPTATGSNINNIDDVSTQTITVSGTPFVTSGRNISAGAIGGSTITASSDLVTTSGAIKTGATTRISSTGAFTGTRLDVGTTNIIATGDLVVESTSSAGSPSVDIKGTAPKIAAIRVTASQVGAAFQDVPPSPIGRASFTSGTNATGPGTFRSFGGGMSAKTGFSANSILTINPTVTGRSNLEKIERINAVSIAMEGASTSNVIAVFNEGFGTSMSNIKQIGGIQNADNSYQDLLIKGRAKNYGTQTLWLPIGSFFDIAGTDPTTLASTGGTLDITAASGTVTAPHYGSPYNSRIFTAPQATAFNPATFKSVFADIVFPTSWAGPGSNVSVIGTYSIDGAPDFSVDTTQQTELMYTLHCVKNMEPTGVITGTANSQTVAEGVCVQRLSSVSSYGSINTQYTGHDNHASANCHVKVPTRVASNTATPLISSYPAPEQDPSQYRWVLRVHRRDIIDSIGNGNSPGKASSGLEASGFTSSVAAKQLKSGIKLMGVSVQYETTHLTDTPLGDYKALS